MNRKNINTLAIELGAKPGAVSMWQRRGLPATWIIKIARHTNFGLDAIEAAWIDKS